MSTPAKRAQDTLIGNLGLTILLIGLPFMTCGGMLLAVFHGTPIEAKLQVPGIVLVSIAGVCLFFGIVLSAAAEIWVRKE